jgi:hypothetical protein
MSARDENAKLMEETRMESSENDKEYSALRDELLVLVGKAFDVWKWSVVSPFALAGAVLLGLSSESSMLTTLARTFPWGTPTLILGIVAAISWVLATLVSDLEETRDRLGSYLAVFHDYDSESLPSDRSSIGYHVWNRIEQSTVSVILRTKAAPRARLYTLSLRFWIYPVIVLGFTIFLNLLIIAVTLEDHTESIYVGVFFSLAIGLISLRFQSKGQSGLTYWTARWREVLELNDDDFVSTLQILGLPSYTDIEAA